jgi:hypothetical protein
VTKKPEGSLTGRRWTRRAEVFLAVGMPLVVLAMFVATTIARRYEFALAAFAMLGIGFALYQALKLQRWWANEDARLSGKRNRDTERPDRN